MKRRNFLKVAGLNAFAISASGSTYFSSEGILISDCATSRDMLGPFFRKNAPFRNDLTFLDTKDEIPLKVIGQVFGADCQSPIPNTLIDIWHCDHKQEYDMESEDFRCRARFHTNEQGEYWFKTFVPPPYGSRPKHIHYLVHEIEGYQELITQLYFKGDKKIKKNNWVKYPWDQKRILDVYKNEEGMAEVRLDLYLQPI